jgi:two-component system chemotaxis response regulator CheB
VTSQGGVGIVQAFDEALYPGMPTAAARAAHVDLVRTVAEMPSLLLDLLRDVPAVPAADPSDLMEMEADMSELDPDAVHHLDRPGVPAGFGCPDCAGALYQIDDGELLRFRCRVGHAWSSESLLERQGTTLESALWMALRSLEEKGALNAELGRRALARGHDRSATRFTQNSEAALEAAELVRRLLDDLAGRAGLTTESAKLDDPDGER